MMKSYVTVRKPWHPAAGFVVGLVLLPVTFIAVRSASYLAFALAGETASVVVAGGTFFGFSFALAIQRHASLRAVKWWVCAGFVLFTVFASIRLDQPMPLLPAIGSMGLRMLIGPAFLAGLAVADQIWGRPQNPRAGHCPACDYDLTGNETGVCPECGHAVA